MNPANDLSIYMLLYKASQDNKFNNKINKNSVNKTGKQSENSAILIQALVYAGNVNGTGSQNVFFLFKLKKPVILPTCCAFFVYFMHIKYKNYNYY